MSTSQRRKSWRESTAAYAASQPLYDALRNGVSRLDRQTANLTLAKDLVQQLHVKLPSVEHHGPLTHEKYLDSIVRAWQSATEIYAEVFDALVHVTAADPTEARDALEGHETFKALAENAATAQRLAMGYECKTSEPRSASPEASGESNHVGYRPGSSTPLILLGKQPTLDSQAEPARSQETQKHVPLIDIVCKEERARLKATRRQLRRSKLKAMKKNEQNTEDKGEIGSVQYEDISAEVEARLKAKEDKKKEKKAEKKRKRESNGSMISVEPTNKPKKKRVKADENPGPDVDGNQEKRKAEVDDAEEDPSADRRKRLRRRV